jgi:hypothetical protein
MDTLNVGALRRAVMRATDSVCGLVQSVTNPEYYKKRVLVYSTGAPDGFEVVNLGEKGLERPFDPMQLFVIIARRNELFSASGKEDDVVTMFVGFDGQI